MDENHTFENEELSSEKSGAPKAKKRRLLLRNLPKIMRFTRRFSNYKMKPFELLNEEE